MLQTGPSSLLFLSRQTWRRFRRDADLLELSHRGLQRQLIPEWLKHPAGMSDRIESSAYGETPDPVIEKMLDALALPAGQLFLDLGCGGGNVSARALDRELSVLAIERNPELWKAARAFLSSYPSVRIDLKRADFLDCDWSPAQAAYTVSARYPASVLEALAGRATATSTLQAIACLGRPLPLDDWTEESLGCFPVTWNVGEQTLSEPLFLYRRPAKVNIAATSQAQVPLGLQPDLELAHACLRQNGGLAGPSGRAGGLHPG